jgi:hypothetical protein
LDHTDTHTFHSRAFDELKKCVGDESKIFVLVLLDLITEESARKSHLAELQSKRLVKTGIDSPLVIITERPEKSRLPENFSRMPNP